MAEHLLVYRYDEMTHEEAHRIRELIDTAPAGDEFMCLLYNEDLETRLLRLRQRADDAGNS